MPVRVCGRAFQFWGEFLKRMTFTVTCRGADGAVREERVEAAGRGECFAQCRARGIAPINVKEGWNGRGKAPNPKKAHGDGRVANSSTDMGTRLSAVNVEPGAKYPSIAGKALLVACLSLAIIGGGAWWWFGRDKARHIPEPKIPKKPSLAKAAKPADAPKTARTDGGR